MAAYSKYLAGLTLEDRTALEGRLLERQSGKCFICDDTIDPVLHQDQLDVDHIVRWPSKARTMSRTSL